MEEYPPEQPKQPCKKKRRNRSMEVARYSLDEKTTAHPDSHETPESAKSSRWRVDLGELTILAFGGGGNLSEPFLYAAAECGARIAIAEILPNEKAAANEQRERILHIARRIARFSGAEARTE